LVSHLVALLQNVADLSVLNSPQNGRW